ncbi:DUF4123 domain-containing protein [Glaciimonas immobilis]|uniref:DUF4123 domain-containing protein n=1 Tax=Glaciimonas immobilis TaxID=728004 RepID=A0A840RZP4_9BURK|nr:DUF4123 domain-containing protein [Glaciimonas immobilis]KAF3995946.1 DUF4123 domain-containing protein [Glaciimonas immobilis]MBB5202702.1 hypothetical protein [Glaciimonas immobilis]
MFYGVDSHHPNLLRQIEATLVTLTEKHQNITTKILINGTFDDELGLHLFNQSKRPPAGIVSLYENSVLSDLEECAPFLLSADSPRLPRLLERSDGVPMFSILQSPLTIHGLQRHFSAFLQVRTPSDGRCFPLAFSDTTCSEDILQNLNENQRNAFCAGFAAWHLVNREGKLTTINGTCFDAASYAPPALGDANAINITDKQFAGLIDSGEADYILRQLFENSPSSVKDHISSVTFHQIRQLLPELNKRELTQEEERYTLIAEAIRLPDFYKALDMLDTVQKLRASSDSK